MKNGPDEKQRLKKRIRDLEEFHRFAEALSAYNTVYETLDFIADWCAKLTHADHAAVLLFRHAAMDSVRTLARSAEGHTGGIDHAINVMAGGWVRAKGRPLITDDVLCELGFTTPTDRQKQFGPLLAAPLYGGEGMTGILNLVKYAGRPEFTQEDLQCMTDTAPLAARFIERARMFENLRLDHARVKASAVRLQDHRWIPSANAEMQETTDRVARVASSDTTVLITGETGTGKELAAWAIHLQSPRATGPFVAVNCGAIPATLADAELFGYERGAFTGADEARPGKFELADGGTLFLDEISSMPMELQPRLLRVLEERRFNRIGSAQPVSVDIRVVIATNRNLEAEVRHGAFREDLFYRLNVFPIHLPPLRERKEDIPILAAAFLAELSGQKSVFSPDALAALREMPWPGNIRELHNLVERVSILCTAPEIKRRELSRLAGGREPDAGSGLFRNTPQLASENPDGINLLEAAEKQLIQGALDQAGGNITKAAQLLGIGRIALHRRLEKFRLSDRS